MTHNKNYQYDQAINRWKWLPLRFASCKYNKLNLKTNKNNARSKNAYAKEYHKLGLFFHKDTT